MKTVHKYALGLPNKHDVVVLAMPLGSEILHIGPQHDRPMVWAMVDPAMPLVDYKLKVFGTGFEIPERYTKSDYVGTVFSGGFVWHFYNAKE